MLYFSCFFFPSLFSLSWIHILLNVFWLKRANESEVGIIILVPFSKNKIKWKHTKMNTDFLLRVQNKNDTMSSIFFSFSFFLYVYEDNIHIYSRCLREILSNDNTTLGPFLLFWLLLLLLVCLALGIWISIMSPNILLWHFFVFLENILYTFLLCNWYWKLMVSL